MGFQKQCPACGSSNSADSPICTCCAHMFQTVGYGQAAGDSCAYVGGAQSYAAYTVSAPSVQSTAEERHLASVMWITAFFFPIFGPGLFLLVCQKSPFVHKNSLQALVFHVWSVVITIALLIFGMFTFGLSLLPLIPLTILTLVVPIIGAVRASKGSIYTPPFSRNWLKA